MTTLNTIIEEEREKFEKLIDSLPSRVRETQKEVVMSFLTDSMQRVAEAVRAEAKLQSVEILHTYAMRTKTTEALDLIEGAQKDILSRLTPDKTDDHATH